MKGSPPVKPISSVGRPVSRTLVQIGADILHRQIHKRIIRGARQDVTVRTLDIAERSGVEPERAEALQTYTCPAVAFGGPYGVRELFDHPRG